MTKVGVESVGRASCVCSGGSWRVTFDMSEPEKSALTGAIAKSVAITRRASIVTRFTELNFACVSIL